MIEAPNSEHFHPEGLTQSQELLLQHLFKTSIKARTRRRYGEPGNYKFIEKVRNTFPIDFAQEGEFALKDHEENPNAPLSPVLLNLRDLSDELLTEIGKNLAEIKLDAMYDFCTGIPTAGKAIAKAYASFSNTPFIDILDKEETVNRREIIAKPEITQFSGKVLVVDDTISEGHSSLEVINAVKNTSHSMIIGFLYVADREQGGIEKLKVMGYETKYIYKFESQVLRFGLRMGMVCPERFNECRKYFSQFRGT